VHGLEEGDDGALVRVVGDESGFDFTVVGGSGTVVLRGLRTDVRVGEAAESRGSTGRAGGDIPCCC
jgi:hypothetical protein